MAISLAQEIAVRGGISQIEQASGAGMTVSYSPYSFDIFSGSFQGRIEAGATLKGEFRKVQFIAGDQILQTVSPIFGDQSRGFFACGAAVSASVGERTKLTIFGGGTGKASGSQLFQLVHEDQPIGTVRLDFKVNDKLTLFDWSLFTSRQSLIGGFDFHPNLRLHFNGQAGMGSNTPYAAISGAFKNDATILEGSYVASSPQFRLLQLNTTSFQEPIEENIHAHHKFSGAVQVDYRRSNYEFNAGNGVVSQFSGDNIFAAGRVHRTGWSASFNEVSGNRTINGVKTLRDGQQASFGMNQDFGFFKVYALHYQPLSASDQSSLQSFTTVTVQEPAGRWVTLRQIINRSNTWGVAYGGELHTNLVSFSLDYQTTYSLFQQGPSQFHQGAVIEGEVNLPRGAKAFVSTNVTPDGRFLYSWGLRTSFLGPYGGGMAAGLDVDEPPEIPRYVVWGQVVDGASGAPIADFPVAIGPEVVFSNENGEFSLRLGSGREIAASPDIKTPHQGYLYGLVDGPKTVHPTKGGPGEQYVWKVKKLQRVAPGKSGLTVSASPDDKSVAAPEPKH